MGALGSLLFLIRRLTPRNRWWFAASQVCLVISVVLELLIPRQIQTVIDEGIRAEDVGIIARTSALMLVFTLLSAVFAIIATRSAPR